MYITIKNGSPIKLRNKINNKVYECIIFMIQSTLLGKINDETLEAYCELNVASDEQFVFYILLMLLMNLFTFQRLLYL